MLNSDSAHHLTNKRVRFTQFAASSSRFPSKKIKSTISHTANLHVNSFSIPLISSTEKFSINSINLQPYRPYTIGRKCDRCEFVFEDHRVSKRHCQLLFDSFDKKIYIADGILLASCDVNSRVRVSLNGVFVNGVRIGSGEVVELRAADEVSFVCGNEGVCSMGRRIGFVVERIAFVEEVVDRYNYTTRVNGLCLNKGIVGSEGVVLKADLLLSRCRDILSKDDPILYIQNLKPKYKSRNLKNNNSKFIYSDVNFPVSRALAFQDGTLACREEFSCGNVDPGKGLLGTNLDGHLCSVVCYREVNMKHECSNAHCKNLEQMDSGGVPCENSLGNGKHMVVSSSSNISPKDIPGVSSADRNLNSCDSRRLQNLEGTHVHSVNGIANHEHVAKSLSFINKEDVLQHDNFVEDKIKGLRVPPPGNKFYLNRLHFMSHDSSEHGNVVSLPELFYPVKSLSQVFITTFTSDISWFLSYCEIPATLPVIIACHNAGRCWSSSPDDRISVPYSDFPNLIVVYPPFSEDIAFGQDRKKLGIACHHPKLIVLQREDNIRVIITSANLVPKQWHSVTNTVWWQDFPRLSTPDYLSLFTESTDGEVNQASRSDFAAQLAKFMSSLVADVPSQAHWVMELTKYDFKGAVGYLIPSIPGIHSPRIPYISESRYLLNGIPCLPDSFEVKVLGSIEASVVGLSHLFRTSADSNGSQLKRLALLIGKCHENVHGMLEIVLRRNTNIPADANAVSVLIPNPEKFYEEDCIQLGFLPRNIAKWVAPLSDAGLFAFSAYVYRKDVLLSASEGNNNKVPLMLYVSQGPNFMSLSAVTQPLLSAMCSLITSIQRSVGLWRLQEVLGHYKWPENSETDFFFGSSSIGSVNPQFLAAFSAAAGKRSLRFSESEESDPEWGCWSASQELRNPSIRIIFPTIERVKSASCGILASKYLLCFSQKTWLRLRNLGILHDAIPYPKERAGHPMHVKVGQRRFKSKTDVSSCGWVYCGSHNFSAAAWGRPISNSSSNGVVRSNAVLGSRLHISNYELGIIFIVPTAEESNYVNKVGTSLEEIVLPFVVPAPKYKPTDRPATGQAMREALAELTELEKQKLAEAETLIDLMEEEMPDEEEERVLVAQDYVSVEKEDEKAYAEKLWSQVDSSQSY